MSKGEGSSRTNRKATRFLSTLLFSVGILLGIALAGSATWADFEAKYYGFRRMGDTPLSGLTCPVLMTTSETGTVSVTLTNPTDKPIQLMARADISNPGLFRMERKTLSLAPGEKGRLDWTVTSDDIDLQFFIFVQVSTYPAYTLPFRGAACGIVVIPLPQFTGKQVFAFTLIASLLGMVIGLGLWEVSNQPLQGRSLHATYAMRFLAVIVLAGMLAGFRGWWGLAGLCLVVAVLMIVVTVSLVLSQ